MARKREGGPTFFFCVSKFLQLPQLLVCFGRTIQSGLVFLILNEFSYLKGEEDVARKGEFEDKALAFLEDEEAKGFEKS